MPMAIRAEMSGRRALSTERRKAKYSTTKASRAPTTKSAEPPPWFSEFSTTCPPSWTLRVELRAASAVCRNCLACEVGTSWG
jgi:hypothetical protein